MFKRLISSIVCLTFIFSNLQYVQAQDFSINQLPVPGILLGESAPFSPLALKGLIVNPKKPLEFQFIVDTGRGPQGIASVKDQANQLVKYFLAGLTIPEGDLWVNLSPYEKTRMIPEALGQTDLGRDLLAQDYILKQLTASLIYPEKDLGKEFWRRVYAKAREQFGTTNVPVNTYNKVWILPDQAQVYENTNVAYVTQSTLKVMLDEDYLALHKHISFNYTHSLASQIVRQIILPEIEKEVNTGKNFAPLRQIYQALILAKWYKETIRNGLLDAIYTNQNKVAGVNLDDPTIKEQIYQRYLKAYKKGAFNYIKDDPTPDGQVVPRKYFSGGITEMMTFNLRRIHDGAMLSKKAIGALLLIAFGLGVVTRFRNSINEIPQVQSSPPEAESTDSSENIVEGLAKDGLEDRGLAFNVVGLMPDETPSLGGMGNNFMNVYFRFKVNGSEPVPFSALVMKGYSGDKLKVVAASFFTKNDEQNNGLPGVVFKTQYYYPDSDGHVNVPDSFSVLPAHVPPGETLDVRLQFENELIDRVEVVVRRQGQKDTKFVMKDVIGPFKEKVPQQNGEGPVYQLKLTPPPDMAQTVSAIYTTSHGQRGNSQNALYQRTGLSALLKPLNLTMSADTLATEKDERLFKSHPLFTAGLTDGKIEQDSAMLTGLLVGFGVGFLGGYSVWKLFELDENSGIVPVLSGILVGAFFVLDLFRLATNTLPYDGPAPDRKELIYSLIINYPWFSAGLAGGIMASIATFKTIRNWKKNALAQEGPSLEQMINKKLMSLKSTKRIEPISDDELWRARIFFKKYGDFKVVLKTDKYEKTELAPNSRKIYVQVKVEETVIQVFPPDRAMLKTSAQETIRDKASLAKNGGIDLNQINVRHNSNVNIQFDPAQLNELMKGGFRGFTPFIIKITPIQSSLPLLGIAPVKK